MTIHANATRTARLINGLADWGAVIASLALVVGVVVATVRVAPGQERAPASTLLKPEVDAPKQTPSLPSTGETLSERLDRTDGVIRPPARRRSRHARCAEGPKRRIHHAGDPAAGQPGRRSGASSRSSGE